MYNVRGGKKGTIANGWRAVLAFHKGDEKYMQKAGISQGASENVAACKYLVRPTT